jgi:hypothetical protein
MIQMSHSVFCHGVLDSFLKKFTIQEKVFKTIWRFLFYLLCALLFSSLLFRSYDFRKRIILLNSCTWETSSSLMDLWLFWPIWSLVLTFLLLFTCLATLFFLINFFFLLFFYFFWSLLIFASFFLIFLTYFIVRLNFTFFSLDFRVLFFLFLFLWLYFSTLIFIFFISFFIFFTFFVIFILLFLKFFGSLFLLLR